MKYATIEDVELLYHPLNAEERKKVDALIPLIISSLRVEADKVGKNLDEMALESENYREVVKSVIIDVVIRSLESNTENEMFSQFTESGLGYSYTGTPANAGGGLFIKRAEYSRLGLRRQRIEVVEIC